MRNVTVALLVKLEAKPGKEKEVEAFLRGALPLVQEEPETLAWFAIPNLDLSIRITNHATVSGSCYTSGSAPRKNASTSFSFPGLASSFTNSATVTLRIDFLFWGLGLRVSGLPSFEMPTYSRSKESSTAFPG